MVESLPILAAAGAVDVLAGLTIEKRFESFLAFPALLVLVPPFLEDSGSLGAILAARISTKLHLGTLGEGRAPWRVAPEDIMLIYVYAVPVFVFLGLTSTIVAHIVGKASPGAIDMLGVSLIAGFFATTSAVIIGYLRSHRDVSVRSRPRQPRDPDRDLEPRPLGRGVAYPGHRHPRARLSPEDGCTRDEMDERPRNLKAMLSEAKDTSELMVDLGYAALFFGDTRMADEIVELEERLTELLHEMREVCVLAGRSKRDAEQMCERAARRVGHRADGQRRGRHLAYRHAPPRHPGRARRRPRRCRGSVAPGTRARRLHARESFTRRRRAPDGSRHARRRNPAWARLDHRSRRRRAAPARRRADPAGRARRHRRAARARRRAEMAAGRDRARIPRSPTSTAQSTCSST